VPGLVAYTFSTFVLASIALEFTRGTRARRSLSGGSWPGAFSALVARNRRRYGGYVVHAAIVLLAIGIAGSSAYGTVRERKLVPGQSMQVAGYTMRFDGISRGRSSNANETRAHVHLSRGGQNLGTLSSGSNYYPAERSSSREVGIRTSWLRAEDYFLIVDDVDRKGAVYFKVLVKPLVNLIWLAGLVFLGGSLIALWPDPRAERRYAARYGAEGVAARV
jgi:cytochrome c-type biogenesis protein CcmF